MFTKEEFEALDLRCAVCHEPFRYGEAVVWTQDFDEVPFDPATGLMTSIAHHVPVVSGMSPRITHARHELPSRTYR